MGYHCPLLGQSSVIKEMVKWLSTCDYPDTDWGSWNKSTTRTNLVRYEINTQRKDLIFEHLCSMFGKKTNRTGKCTKKTINTQVQYVEHRLSAIKFSSTLHLQGEPSKLKLGEWHWSVSVVRQQLMITRKQPYTLQVDAQQNLIIHPKTQITEVHRNRIRSA